ncbi:MAG: arginine deiminase family protein [bacterium]|nr:arginine deiminase family protein [bacterium]
MNRRGKEQVRVFSEYGRLSRVLVHGGNTMILPRELKSLLGKHSSLHLLEEEKYHPESGVWDRNMLRDQLADLQNVLWGGRGVRLVYAWNVHDAWTQFFTRDACFVVGDTLYLGVFRDPIRKLEKRGVEFLKNQFDKVVELTTPSIEGGDVFVHGDKVFVGIGRQTTHGAFKELQGHLEPQGFHCVPVECNESVLHLDCRFNIIGPDKAMILPDGISLSGIATLEKYFELVVLVGEEHKKSLATNYLIISPREVIVDERNTQVADILQDARYRVIPIPFTEPTKVWGGIRCATCPLVRE